MYNLKAGKIKIDFISYIFQCFLLKSDLFTAPENVNAIKSNCFIKVK